MRYKSQRTSDEDGVPGTHQSGFLYNGLHLVLIEAFGNLVGHFNRDTASSDGECDLKRVLFHHALDLGDGRVVAVGDGGFTSLLDNVC